MALEECVRLPGRTDTDRMIDNYDSREISVAAFGEQSDIPRKSAEICAEIEIVGHELATETPDVATIRR